MDPSKVNPAYLRAKDLRSFLKGRRTSHSNQQINGSSSKEPQSEGEQTETPAELMDTRERRPYKVPSETVSRTIIRGGELVYHKGADRTLAALFTKEPEDIVGRLMGGPSTASLIAEPEPANWRAEHEAAFPNLYDSDSDEVMGHTDTPLPRGTKRGATGSPPVDDSATDPAIATQHCDSKGKTPIRDTLDIWIDELPQTVKNHRLGSIPVGTFSEDGADPRLCRVVYLTLSRHGEPHYHLSNHTLNGQPYMGGRQERLTKKERKTAKGSVGFKAIKLIKPVRDLQPSDIGLWAFEYFRRLGVTDSWGVDSYQDLTERGKQKPTCQMTTESEASAKLNPSNPPNAQMSNPSDAPVLNPSAKLSPSNPPDAQMSNPSDAPVLNPSAKLNPLNPPDAQMPNQPNAPVPNPSAKLNPLNPPDAQMPNQPNAPVPNPPAASESGPLNHPNPPTGTDTEHQGLLNIIRHLCPRILAVTTEMTRAWAAGDGQAMAAVNEERILRLLIELRNVITATIDIYLTQKIPRG